MQITEIRITYASNYNGLYLSANEGLDMEDEMGDEIAKQAEEIKDEILEFAVDDCDDDGEYCGDIDQLEEYAIGRAKKMFGQDVLVTFEEDSMSS